MSKSKLPKFELEDQKFITVMLAQIHKINQEVKHLIPNNKKFSKIFDKYCKEGVCDYMNEDEGCQKPKSLYCPLDTYLRISVNLGSQLE